MSQVFGYEVGSWIVPFHLVPISLSVDCVHVSVLGDMQDAFRRSLQQEKNSPVPTSFVNTFFVARNGGKQCVHNFRL